MNADGIVDLRADAYGLEPELREYDRQFSAIRADAELLLDGLTERELVWRDGSGTWSIIECLNHLESAVPAHASSLARVIAAGVTLRR